MKRTRTQLHEEAERIGRALVARFGGELPEDVRTTLGYYIACRGGFDRAAEHVLHLVSLVKEES